VPAIYSEHLNETIQKNDDYEQRTAEIRLLLTWPNSSQASK